MKITTPIFGNKVRRSSDLKVYHFVIILFIITVLAAVFLLISKTAGLKWMPSDKAKASKELYTVEYDKSLAESTVSLVYDGYIYYKIPCFVIDEEYKGKLIGKTIKWAPTANGEFEDFMAINTTPDNDIYSVKGNPNILYIVNNHTNLADIMFKSNIYNEYADKNITELYVKTKEKQPEISVEKDGQALKLPDNLVLKLFNDSKNVEDYKLSPNNTYVKEPMYIRFFTGALYKSYLSINVSDNTLFFYESSKRGYDIENHELKYSAYILPYSDEFTPYITTSPTPD